MNLITQRLQDAAVYQKNTKQEMSMKDLAITIWACARIKMPKDSQLPLILNEKACQLLV